MLLLAQAAIPRRFEVATVDHGLRPEAANECAMVARVCAERGIPCEVLKVKVSPGNLQARARDARYSGLLKWAGRRAITAVATAHHADDQAETLLMRLNRASGVAGLAGVRERTVLDFPTAEVMLIRPLLEFRRRELGEVVLASGLSAVTDPSNSDDQFDRARLRKALANVDWLDTLALARSAGHLAEAEDALQEFTTLQWSSLVRPEGDSLRFYPLTQRLMRFRLIERIIRELGGKPRGTEIATLLDRLDAGSPANLSGVLATVEAPEWVFRREPPRRPG
jgi:tRNA(Ile)-lysidine synthase